MAANPSAEEWIKCPECNGKGWTWWREGETNVRCECTTCEGEGQLCNLTYVDRGDSPIVAPPEITCSELVIPARCPHCGGKADLESGESIYDKTMQRQLYYAAVVCSNRITCCAAMSMILNNEDAARTMCVEQWNRRYNNGGEPLP